MSNVSVFLSLKKFPKPEETPFEAIKDSYLGKKYDLSLVFCGKKLMRRINRETRGKDYATDVLSFPYSEQEGEMFICLPVCKTRCKKFDRDYENFLGFIFIHGLVHLNGYDHGDTMEQEEVRVRKRFGI